MEKKFKKDAEMLLSSQMEVLKGGVGSGCSSCCDRENGGTNTQTDPVKQDP